MLGGGILTVAQLNRYIKASFDDNKLLSSLLIKGEISNLSDHFSSGHIYFSLKDESSSIKAIMFKSYAAGLKFRPQNGQTVIVSCSVTVYERDGIYQLYVYDIQPDGVGALALAFAQLKEKLAAEGLFAQDHKRALPAMPRVIGVITSQSGAVLQDILNVLSRRYPLARVVLAPVSVQGEKAADEIALALKLLNAQKKCEVIILGRGGGSQESLQAFNTEAVVRAIYASSIPVISAVGHETDFTLADLAADERAPTPSAAAELAAPDINILFESINTAAEDLKRGMQKQLAVLSSRLDYYKAHRALQSPVQTLYIKAQYAEKLKNNLYTAMQGKLLENENAIKGKAALLSSLSPLNVLSRGYAIAFASGTAVTSSAQLSIGEQITVKLKSGEISAQVTEVTEERT